MSNVLRDLFPKWARIVASFWFVRGLLTAFSLVGLVGDFIDLQKEFLDAFIAIILSWNGFAGWIGGLVGSMFHVPPIPHAFVNAIILILSFSLPAAIYSHKCMVAKGIVRKGIFSVDFGWNFAPIILLYPLIFVITAGYISDEPVESVRRAFFLLLYVLSAIVIAVTTFGYRSFLKDFPYVGRGIFFVVGFIFCSAILYQFTNDKFREKIRGFNCNMLQDAPNYCPVGKFDSKLPHSTALNSKILSAQ